jgi:two-component system chemotaxis response regulator CheY
MCVRSYDILIVDDDRTSRLILERRLRTLSYTNIDVARDGVEALQRLVAKPYDLIFLDNHMPRMSGLELLRRCKAVTILDGTAVFLLTGTADGATVQSVKREQLKVDDFIIKPLEIEVLRAKLERLSGKLANRSEPVGLEAARNPETGAFLSIGMDVSGPLSRLKLFGTLHQDDKQAIKDLPDRVCLAPTESILIDMRDVLSIDEFGIGMLLLINGIACMAGKLTYLLLDAKTINPRLIALGISEIMRVIEHESEVILPNLG